MHPWKLLQNSWNVSTHYKWYEWGRPRAWRALRQSLTSSITLSLFFFCFSSSFPSVSARPYAFPRARLVKEVFEIPPEDISPRRFSFMSRRPNRRQNSPTPTPSSTSSSQAHLFLSRVTGSIKSMTLPNHKTVTEAKRRLIEFIPYWRIEQER